MYRIGELARRTETSADLLRAWERRYGLLRPQRTAGGFRLYTDDDANRVDRMRTALGRGIAAAEAARLALADAPETEPSLLDALLSFDDERANAILDEALGRLSLETVLSSLVLPTLRAIGDGWEAGDVSVAQEHYAANVIRGRLLSLANRWDQGVGPRALLACAPGDLHDLPLVCFGLALRRRGWRILFLGTDTPYDVLLQTAAAESPDLVLVASSVQRPELDDPRLLSLAAATPLVLAGLWPDLDASVRRLAGDPVELAAVLGAYEGSPGSAIARR